MKDDNYYRDLLDKTINFIHEIRSEHRFHLRTLSGVQELFLHFKEEGASRLTKGTNLYRARYDKDQTELYNPIPICKMGAPPYRKRSGGRINPEGIACLYCATDEKTAISEVRPWVEARITVATGNLKRELNILDVEGANGSTAFQNKGHNQKIFELLINRLFSSRQSPEDKSVYYPSQYLSEYVKVHGFDGIKYHSSLSESGKNIALFDEENVEFQSTREVKVEKVSYEYSILSN